jgi:Flp pilus assembly protein TadG
MWTSKRLGSARSARRTERGVTLVVMALMLLLALSMSALAIDYGMIKSAKAEAQRAMDAAALAGASVFIDVLPPGSDLEGLARQRAKEYAAKHDVHRVLVDSAAVQVDVSLLNHTVQASYSPPAIGLWFARTFGDSTMRITASATARAVDAGISTCLMPVALPDKWLNHSPDPSEDANGDGILDWNDVNGNRQWDWSSGKGKGSTPETWEQWIYDPSEGDVYRPPNSDSPTGYTTSDYGRQIPIMELDPNSTATPSNYLGWGNTGADASDSAMQARIRNPDCSETQIAQDYVRAANGSRPNIGQAWADRINSPPSADWTWNNSTNTVSCPGGCPDNWQDVSPRVVTIGLYDPAILTRPQDNTIQFLNFAKVFLDQRPCSGAPGSCKAEVTARFLGYARGVGGPGAATGPLNKRLVLIK